MNEEVNRAFALAFEAFKSTVRDSFAELFKFVVRNKLAKNRQSLPAFSVVHEPRSNGSMRKRGEGTNVDQNAGTNRPIKRRP
ncbi:hypothetical protein RMSM_01747 [Rhodopirellula maiorica SM1]|uniref:Uncharacterized protein n=1 Tax=Rhodopirellula maiorica SM1 TaxID=1265738 RepID=M5S574_9BACT|nr:hypothetical protein RMSM_01747 [Rhodopirellula maiorica SM1]